MEPKLTPHWLLSLHTVSRGHAACDFWNDDIYVCQAQAVAALLPVVSTATRSSRFYGGACSCAADVGYGSSCGVTGSAWQQLFFVQASACVLLAMRMPSKPRGAACAQARVVIAVALLLGTVAAVWILPYLRQPWQREKPQQWALPVSSVVVARVCTVPGNLVSAACNWQHRLSVNIPLCLPSRERSPGHVPSQPKLADFGRPKQGCAHDYS